MGRWLPALACALLVGAGGGCVSYRSGALPKGGGLVTPSDPPSKSISIVVRVSRMVNGEEGDLPDRLRESWIQATLGAYQKSGLFTDVKRGRRADTDLQAAVTIEDYVFASEPFTFLSGLTWLLLPARSRDRLSVRTIYRLQGGEIVGQFRSREEVTTWFQAFLLPVTIFARRDPVIERTLVDLSRATAESARRKGIL